MDGRICRIENLDESEAASPKPRGVSDVHGSVAAFGSAGVLITGKPGSGKSDLVLRLIDRGWTLVADDRVHIQAGWAEAPASLAGLLEVRGFGILCMERHRRVQLRLVVTLGEGARLPAMARHETFGLPAIQVDPERAAAPQIIELALKAALGEQAMVAGAFA